VTQRKLRSSFDRPSGERDGSSEWLMFARSTLRALACALLRRREVAVALQERRRSTAALRERRRMEHERQPMLKRMSGRWEETPRGLRTKVETADPPQAVRTCVASGGVSTASDPRSLDPSKRRVETAEARTSPRGWKRSPWTPSNDIDPSTSRVRCLPKVRRYVSITKHGRTQRRY
jgi:hypothetical protein